MCELVEGIVTVPQKLQDGGCSGDVPVRVRRLLVCPCHGPGEPKRFAALDLGAGPAPELAYVGDGNDSFHQFTHRPRSAFALVP